MSTDSDKDVKCGACGRGKADWLAAGGMTGCRANDGGPHDWEAPTSWKIHYGTLDYDKEAETLPASERGVTLPAYSKRDAETTHAVWQMYTAMDALDTATRRARNIAIAVVVIIILGIGALIWWAR